MDTRDHSVSAWAANWPVVVERWPKVAESLQQTVAAIPEVVCRREGTFRIDGIQLSSAYDRRGEALLQASRIPADATEAYVYGLGMGDLPRCLLERKALQRLHVLLMAPRADKAVLERETLSDWLADPRVSLAWVTANDGLSKPYAVNPSSLSLAGREAYVLRDLLAMELNREFARSRWLEQEPTLVDRIRESTRTFASDPDVSQLFKTNVGTTMVIAGGGPTLPESFPWLRDHAETCPLVAATTALIPLAKAGIHVSLAMALDPHADLLGHYANLDRGWLSSIPLVYSPIVDPLVVSQWPGPRYAFVLDSPTYKKAFPEHPRSKLFCGGSVVHSAMGLAAEMGATSMVFAGLDFCYVGGVTHADGASYRGAVDSQGRRMLVSTGEGKEEFSELNLISYLRDTEQFIAQHPHIRFYNASQRGARIRGTRNLKEWRPSA